MLENMHFYTIFRAGMSSPVVSHSANGTPRSDASVAALGRDVFSRGEAQPRIVPRDATPFALHASSHAALSSHASEIAAGAGSPPAARRTALRFATQLDGESLNSPSSASNGKFILKFSKVEPAPNSVFHASNSARSTSSAGAGADGSRSPVTEAAGSAARAR